MVAELLLLVGTYTQPEPHVATGGGAGIVTCAFDPATGKLEQRSVFSNILNPSYLTIDAERRRVFAVSENIAGEGAVYQFDWDAGGVLVPVARQDSHGVATCHVGLLPDERVAAAAYVSGRLAIFPLEQGRLAPASRVFQYAGTGPNPERQEASHAHQTVVAPDARWFYVCDLGADCVWQHDMAAMAEPCGWPMPPGHGPRHLVFHPGLPLAYVLGELTGAVAVCDWNPTTGELRVAATTPVQDEDAAAAAIRLHPSRQTLWISVRKHARLVAFHLDEHGQPGAATEMTLATGEPRDFSISPDGRWLISANQSADELVVVELEPATGQPTGRPFSRFALRTPVCVAFLSAVGSVPAT